MDKQPDQHGRHHHVRTAVVIRLATGLAAMLGLCGYMFLTGTNAPAPPASNACGPSIIDAGKGPILVDKGTGVLFISKQGC